MKEVVREGEEVKSNKKRFYIKANQVVTSGV